MIDLCNIFTPPNAEMLHVVPLRFAVNHDNTSSFLAANNYWKLIRKLNTWTAWYELLKMTATILWEIFFIMFFNFFSSVSHHEGTQVVWLPFCRAVMSSTFTQSLTGRGFCLQCSGLFLSPYKFSTSFLNLMMFSIKVKEKTQKVIFWLFNCSQVPSRCLGLQVWWQEI